VALLLGGMGACTAGNCSGRLRWEIAVGDRSRRLCSGLLQRALAFLCGRVGGRLRVPSLRALGSPVPAPSLPVLNGVGCLQQNG